MNYCLFLLAQDIQPQTDPADTAALSRLCSSLRAVPGLTRLVSHRAVGGVRDPAIKQTAGPDYAFQLYFDELLSLECALGPGSVVDRSLSSREVFLRSRLRWCHQAMAVRRYLLAVQPLRPESAVQHASTYFVSYEGQSADDERWLSHYLRHHPPIMKKLPGLRRLEVYSRVDCCSDLDIEKSRALQRNIVMFDSGRELNDALSSPVREELRADYNAFPAFKGTSPHCAMISEILAPAS